MASWCKELEIVTTCLYLIQNSEVITSGCSPGEMMSCMMFQARDFFFARFRCQFVCDLGDEIMLVFWGCDAGSSLPGGYNIFNCRDIAN